MEDLLDDRDDVINDLVFHGLGESLPDAPWLWHDASHS
jgi:hypothetical protein